MATTTHALDVGALTPFLWFDGVMVSFYNNQSIIGYLKNVKN